MKNEKIEKIDAPCMPVYMVMAYMIALVYVPGETLALWGIIYSALLVIAWKIYRLEGGAPK